MNSSLRVIAGRWKNRRLAVAPGSRPTSERAREALFDILGSWIEGRTVLELFAASGAVAIEALSRGASAVTAADLSAGSVKKNCQALGIVPVIREEPVHETIRCLRREHKTFDLIFLDPPYGLTSHLTVADVEPLLAPGGLLVWQSGTGNVPESGSSLTPERVARYGRNVFQFFRRSS